MNTDPIVKEVREAGAKLATEAGGDIHRFFENLRRTQEDYGKRLIREPVQSCESTSKAGRPT